MDDWFEDAGGGAAVDVAAILDSDKVLSGVTEIVQLGALISLGLTSDGGALGVTVMFDERRKKVWVRDSEDLEAWLAEGVPTVRRLAEKRRQDAPNGRSSRRR